MLRRHGTPLHYLAGNDLRHPTSARRRGFRRGRARSADAQQRFDVDVVRLRFERIPGDDHEVDALLDNRGDGRSAPGAGLWLSPGISQGSKRAQTA